MVENKLQVLSPLNKDSIVTSMISIITEIIRENMEPYKAKLREEQKLNSFFTKKIPSISIQGYLERILKYSKMEESTLILVLILIDKLSENSNFLLTDNNIHR